MTDLVDEGRAPDISYLDICKVFDTASHKFVIAKILINGLNEQTVR